MNLDNGDNFVRERSNKEKIKKSKTCFTSVNTVTIKSFTGFLKI